MQVLFGIISHCLFVLIWQPEIGSVNFDDVSLHLEYWEELLFKFNEMKRYRRIVGSLVGSCLKAASPLVSSQKESACLVSLDIYWGTCLICLLIKHFWPNESLSNSHSAVANTVWCLIVRRQLNAQAPINAGLGRVNYAVLSFSQRELNLVFLNLSFYYIKGKHKLSSAISVFIVMWGNLLVTCV